MSIISEVKNKWYEVTVLKLPKWGLGISGAEYYGRKYWVKISPFNILFGQLTYDQVWVWHEKKSEGMK